MPTVLCLGGTDQFGLPSARHLAADSVVALLKHVGADPGVTDVCERHLLEALDEPQVLMAMRHWLRLLDCWTDLFDAYIELP